MLSVITDRADATYHQGETVTFQFALKHFGKPVEDGKIGWSLTKDGVAPMQNGEVTLKEGRATVTGSLAEPGFLQCKAGYKTDKDKDKGSVRGIGSAAIDPQLIKPSLPVPDDFDAFWAGKRKLLAAVPVNATMKAVTPAPPGIDLFDVQADAIGDKPMRGLYARPTGAKPKSLPAIITLEGAGVYATRREPWLLAMAKEGFLSLEINAHGLPNDQPAAFYLALERGDLKDYEMMGRNSRETCYFLNMYLRAQRAVDFLTSQPEWDGKILISNGTSQGGAQAIFLAATEPRVTFLMAAVPAMCDHSGMVAGRVPGWPRLVPFAADGKPDPAVLETSRYFDSVNFCSRLRVPCLFAVGFLDQVSPPTTIYAAYNSVPSEKEIYPSPLSPHRLDPVMWPEIKRRLLLHK